MGFDWGAILPCDLKASDCHSGKKCETPLRTTAQATRLSFKTSKAQHQASQPTSCAYSAFARQAKMTAASASCRTARPCGVRRNSVSGKNDVTANSTNSRQAAVISAAAPATAQLTAFCAWTFSSSSPFSSCAAHAHRCQSQSQQALQMSLGRSCVHTKVLRNCTVAMSCAQRAVRSLLDCCTRSASNHDGGQDPSTGSTGDRGIPAVVVRDERQRPLQVHAGPLPAVAARSSAAGRRRTACEESKSNAVMMSAALLTAC